MTHQLARRQARRAQGQGKFGGAAQMFAQDGPELQPQAGMACVRLFDPPGFLANAVLEPPHARCVVSLADGPASHALEEDFGETGTAHSRGQRGEILSLQGVDARHDRFDGDRRMRSRIEDHLLSHRHLPPIRPHRPIHGSFGDRNCCASLSTSQA